jgi:hypothetical protein
MGGRTSPVQNISTFRASSVRYVSAVSTTSVRNIGYSKSEFVQNKISVH